MKKKNFRIIYEKQKEAGDNPASFHMFKIKYYVKRYN